MREHRYRTTVRWHGATTGYRNYSRDHLIGTEGRPDIAGSSDPAFLGSPERWNPEQLLLASISACHKLWFLHLAAEAGLVVTAYADEAEGVMMEDGDSGRFTQVTLHPRVTLAEGDPHRVASLHEAAHRSCFVANSLSFPVHILQS